MAHQEEIIVNSVITQVTVLDSSAQEMDDVVERGRYISNLNLLDNRYFADPINQRGQTEYTNSGYTIDRWAITGGTTLLVEDGHITLSMSAAYGAMYQYFEYLPTGHTYTFSLLRTDGTLWKFTFAWDGTQKAHWPSDDYYLEMNMVDGKPRIAIISNGANKSVSIIAVKLELGTNQTLAHQDADGNWVLNDPPPNKALELAKCQRYYQLFTSADKRPSDKRDFRPEMRTNATSANTGTIEIDGVTYYYADANL